MTPAVLRGTVLGSSLGILPGGGSLLSAFASYTIEKKLKLRAGEIPFGKGTIRVDGRKLHPAYLFEVKKPEESKGPWDYYKLIGTTPGDQAFRPLSESACPLVKK